MTVHIVVDFARRMAALSEGSGHGERLGGGEPPVMKYWMETHCCGASVLGRDVDLWTDGETDRCPDCGDLVWVSCDSESPAELAQADEPLDNWPHPWPTSRCEPVLRERLAELEAERAGKGRA